MPYSPNDLVIQNAHGDIWNQVCNCESFGQDLNGFLKSVDYGERSYTSIDAYVQIRKATEIFGPMGKGFGLRRLKLIHVLPMVKQTRRGEIPGNLAMFQAEFWWMEGGEFYFFEVMEDIFLDTSGDSLKKVVTGMITKSLSYLGWNYDVFRGRFNDVKTFDSPASDEEKAALSELLKRIKPEAALKISSYHNTRGYLRPDVLADIKKIRDALAKKEASSGQANSGAGDAVGEEGSGGSAGG